MLHMRTNYFFQGETSTQLGGIPFDGVYGPECVLVVLLPACENGELIESESPEGPPSSF